MGLSDFVNSIVTNDKFSATFKKFDSAVDGSAKGLDRLGNFMSSGNLAMLFGGAAGVAGVAAIGKTIWNLGELGAQSLTTKASFESLMASVGQSPALLGRMTDAAGGTITQLQLMQQANTALAGTSGQLARELAGAIPQLIEAGRAAAQLNPSMGDAAFMTQSLITGIKRGSPMLIDNTGITLKLGEATEAYAKSVGKSVNELTAQERSIAILRATLESSDTLIKQVGGSLNNATSDMQSAKIAAEELKTALGELFAPTLAVMASNAADAIREFTAIINKDTETQLSFELKRQIGLLDLYTSYVAKNADEEAARQVKIAQTITKVSELQHAMLVEEQAAQRAGAATGMAFDAVSGAINGVSGAVSGAIVDVNRLRDSMYELGLASGSLMAGKSSGAAASSFSGNYGSAVTRLAGTPMEWDAINQASLKYAASIATLDQDLKDHVITYGEYKLAVERLSLGLNDLVSSFNDVGGASSDVESKLKSLISQKLQPTFDLSGLTGGLLGGAGGDTFDEAYKRLAAVALRPQEELSKHAGDWADTFEQAGLTGLSPEDAQARAKELVEAYSKGLDFSLIDKEAIKDSIRQAIKADELFQSMVDEIYAEMGKPKPELTTAGEKMGAQINAGVLIAAKNGGKLYNEALARAVSPYVADILKKGDARYQ